MRKLADDIRYALRLLAKSPGIASIAIATLALGIGANTAIFSVADSLLWKPIPLPQPDRLMMVMDRYQQQSGWIPTSPANLADWQRDSRSFEFLAAWSPESSVNLTTAGAYGDEPERLAAVRVTPAYLDVMGVKPILGRWFSPEDHEAELPRVALIANSIWVRRFGSAPDAVGQRMVVDGREVTVIGVLPADLQDSPRADMVLPLAMSPQNRAMRSSHNLFGAGRLKPGVTVPQAQAEMNGIAERLAQQFPESNRDWSVMLMPVREFILGPVRPQALMLLGAAGFVLLMACANVANIQFGRVTGRSRELAVRVALGAPRGRIVRQLFTESLVLAASGGALGLLVAMWGIAAIRGSLPAAFADQLVRWGGLNIEWHALGFTGLCSAAAGLLSGIAPALRSTRANPNDALKHTRPAQTAGAHRFRNLLAVGEIAVAMMLLIGAGLMVKGYAGLLAREKNPDPRSVLTMRLTLPESRYAKAADVRAFYNQLLERVQSLPGVVSASLATAFPHSAVRSNTQFFTREGRQTVRPGEQTLCIRNLVSADYFRTMQIALLSGRPFGASDSTDAPRVAIISHGMAEQFWPGEDPVGKRLRLGGPEDNVPWITIAGVAADVVLNPYDRAPSAALYLPQAQMTARSVHLVVRSPGDASALATPVQREIRGLDRAQPVYQVMTLETLIANQTVATRAIAVLMSLFGGLAMALAAIGIYGVIAWSVTERTHEIGIRMALGAESSQVLSLVLRRGMAVAAGGIAAGMAGAFALARSLANQIYGVSATDIATFASVPWILLAVALVATWIPARRATKVDPVRALRCE